MKRRFPGRCRLTVVSALLAMLGGAPAQAEGAEYQFKMPVRGLSAPAAEENVFRFRHIHHATEGWADIVIAPVSETLSITDEVQYRAAAQNAAFEAFYTIPDAWRCDSQDFGPDVVPEVDWGCNNGWGTALAQYVLYSMPEGATEIPAFLFRAHDREYGQYGSGYWVSMSDHPQAPVVGSITFQEVFANGWSVGVEPTLQSGQWVVGSDPATDKRN